MKLEYDTADFSVTVLPTSPVAAAGGYTEFEITFDPTMPGIRNAAVSIANDDPDESPYNFVIQGIGFVQTAPDMQVRDDTGTWLIPDGDQSPSPSDGTDFGSVDINGGQVAHWFQVHNVGTADLNLTGNPHVVWSIGNTSDFTVNIQPASPVAAGSAARFEVVFKPTAVGLHAVVLSIANDDSDSNPYTFILQGVGIDPLACRADGHSGCSRDYTRCDRRQGSHRHRTRRPGLTIAIVATSKSRLREKGLDFCRHARPNERARLDADLRASR